MSAPEVAGAPRRRLLLYLLPLGFFLALALVFLFRLQSGISPNYIPSALIAKPAPVFDLPALEGSGLPGLKTADLDGQVTVVNIYASWCGPCRIEHPALMALATDDRYRMAAINYKDKPANGLAFLEELGNPYDAIGTDRKGRVGIEWGVFGVPETFVVDAGGIVRFKFIGPLSDAAVETQLMPAIEEALAAQAAGASSLSSSSGE
ncbi:MAG: DsbE family thiol:disulfide interchange protein [Alphaproteobacteria bacterium]